MQATFRHRSPYSFLAEIAVPNFTKAIQTLSRNESMARQALLACALERYRLANGEYPQTLEALAPNFVKQLPKDTIQGATLRYRRNATGFVLYSVGWNEKDDGGLAGQSAAEGDWVWNAAR
jgi:type II secretory pathway pseudopilin PulG